MVRRVITLVTVALVMAAMMVFAGPASAQGGWLQGFRPKCPPSAGRVVSSKRRGSGSLAAPVLFVLNN
jgi:hypothetical protein